MVQILVLCVNHRRNCVHLENGNIHRKDVICCLPQSWSPLSSQSVAKSQAERERKPQPRPESLGPKWLCSSQRLKPWLKMPSWTFFLEKFLLAPDFNKSDYTGLKISPYTLYWLLLIYPTPFRHSWVHNPHASHLHGPSPTFSWL